MSSNSVVLQNGAPEYSINPKSKKYLAHDQDYI